jgi:acyl-CoA thioesterase-2
VREEIPAEAVHDTDSLPFGQEALDNLVEVLTLEPIEENIFRGHHPVGGLRRTFGGQTAAQALVAAVRTVPTDRTIHSLHSYFLRPGDPDLPTVFMVERIRDGGSFSTRRVHGIQHGKAIYSFAASFQIDEPGYEHADAMPDVPDPESLPPAEEVFEQVRGRMPLSSALVNTTDFRAVDLHPFQQREIGPRETSRHRVWLKAAGSLPDDPVLHLAMVAYMSDMSLLHPVLVKHGIAFAFDPVMGASLDHAIWFHRPLRADDWLLYDAISPSASGARGLAMGQMYSRDGTLVASVAQEGLIRPIDPDQLSGLQARHNPLRQQA